jgi:hypothetical protein
VAQNAWSLSSAEQPAVTSQQMVSNAEETASQAASSLPLLAGQQKRQIAAAGTQHERQHSEIAKTAQDAAGCIQCGKQQKRRTRRSPKLGESSVRSAK